MKAILEKLRAFGKRSCGVISTNYEPFGYNIFCTSNPAQHPGNTIHNIMNAGSISSFSAGGCGKVIITGDMDAAKCKHIFEEDRLQSDIRIEAENLAPNQSAKAQQKEIMNDLKTTDFLCSERS